MFRKTYLILMGFSKQMIRKNVKAFASSSAFFLFLSLIPMLMLLFTIVPYTFLAQEEVSSLLISYIPDGFDGFANLVMEDVLAYRPSVMILAIFVMLWSAGKGMNALLDGLDCINDTDWKGNFVTRRIKSGFYTLILLLALVMIMVLMIFGRTIKHTVLSLAPEVIEPYLTLISFRGIFSVFVLTLLFALIYAYVPVQKDRAKRQLPGAVFSATVWTLTSWGFSFYIDHFNGFSTYGTMAAVIMVMMYLYMMMYIILIGAHINRYFRPIFNIFPARLDKKTE